MIKISAEELEQGLKMARIVSQCSDAIACFWDGKECKKNCGLSNFRRIFERNSPAIFGLLRNFSEYKSILQDLARMEIEGDEEQKHQARERFHDLQTWTQIAVVTFYPLFLANGEDVPFLKNEEVKEAEKDYLDAEPEDVREELERINSAWFGWIASIFENICDESWAKKWFSILMVFLRGIKKYEPPAEFVSQKDENAFFEKINEFLCSQTK